MRILIALLLLVPAQSGRDATIRVIQSKDGNVVAQPIVSPVLGFRLEAGQAPEGILRCEQHSEYRTTGTVRYPVVLLRCEGGRVLVLTDVDLRQ